MTKAALVAGDRAMDLGEIKPFGSEIWAVAYVDLLGFKAMILNDPTGKDLVPVLEEAIAEALAFAALIRDTTTQLGYRIFSDNVCFWCKLEAGPLSLSTMLATLSEFQLRLALRGIFCRGAVTIGHHYASEHVLYGPALVEAVELEKLADYPRILVSDAIMAAPELLKMAVFYYQIHRLDDAFFVNYLWGIYFNEREHGVRQLRRHAECVLHALERHKDQPPVVRKYQWSRSYHNDAVSHLTYPTDGLFI